MTHWPSILCHGGVRRSLAALALSCAALASAGCEREDMHNQARHEWQEASDFFANGMSSRQQVEGTVSRSQPLSTDPVLAWRRGDGGFADAYPMQIDRAALERGRQRYDIYCSMCHGATGYGDGMIVRRGFAKPPSFHDERLRAAAPGYFVEVITHGFGAMYSYNDRVPPDDRWRIAAYVKTLQLSRRVDVASLTAEDRQRVEASAAAPASTQPADPSRDPRRQGESENNGMRGASR